MNTRDPKSLIEKLKVLSPEGVGEVEDFVDLLHAREQERALMRPATRVAESAFAGVWDNDEDAVCDRL
jgi:hypothetical protein